MEPYGFLHALQDVVSFFTGCRPVAVFADTSFVFLVTCSGLLKDLLSPLAHIRVLFSVSAHTRVCVCTHTQDNQPVSFWKAWQYLRHWQEGLVSCSCIPCTHTVAWASVASKCLPGPFIRSVPATDRTGSVMVCMSTWQTLESLGRLASGHVCGMRGYTDYTEV